MNICKSSASSMKEHKQATNSNFIIKKKKHIKNMRQRMNDIIKDDACLSKIRRKSSHTAEKDK